MEAKIQLNLKVDRKNEWRIDTCVAIKPNDTNTSYGMRYLLNQQVPTVETLGKEHLDFHVFRTVFSLATVSYRVFCELDPVWPILCS